MNKKTETITAVIIGLFLFLGISVVAQEMQRDTNRTETLMEQQELRRQIEARTQELRQMQDQMRQPGSQGTSSRVMPSRETLSPEAKRERAREHMERFEAERERMVQGAQARREEQEDRVREKRDEMRDEMEQKRQEYREKLAQIREERHQQLAENLTQRMNQVNQNRSNAALNYLDALELVLSKIEARANFVQDATGVDLAAVKTKIAEARQLVNQTRDAVLAQKSKEYILEIESEGTLGQNIRNAMRQVRDDHKRLREEVLHPLRGLIKDIMMQLKDAVSQHGEAGESVLEDNFEEQEQ